MALMPKTPKRAEHTRVPEIPCFPGTLNKSKSPITPKRIVLSIEEKRDVLKKLQLNV